MSVLLQRAVCLITPCSVPIASCVSFHSLNRCVQGGEGHRVTMMSKFVT